MQEERMLVLKMVDEGKICVDEATKLLDALKTTGAHAGPTFEEKFNSFTNDTKEFFKDVGCKINKMYKNAEPKIKDAAKTVVAKTADIADNISQSLNEKVKDMNEQPCGECCAPEANAPQCNGPRPECDGGEEK